MLTDDGLGKFSCSEKVNLAEKVNGGEYRHQIVTRAHPLVRYIQPAALLL
jgi:hypothetical protein